MEYRNNHTIPRVILNHWATEIDSRTGVFVYDIIKDRDYFSSAIGKKAFSFAIEDSIYVPEIDSVRHPNLEKWKSGIEGSLSQFIEKIKNKERSSIVKDSAELNKILMGLFSLNYVSTHDLKLTHDFIDNNPDFRAKISGQPERETRLLVLENIVNVVSIETQGVLPVDFIVTTITNDKEFIYCDRPFINNAFDGLSFIVLSNKIILAFKKSEDISTIDYIESKDNFVDVINDNLAMQSRNWIISASQRQLHSHKNIICSKRWRESKKNDHALFTDNPFNVNGVLLK